MNLLCLDTYVVGGASSVDQQSLSLDTFASLIKTSLSSAAKENTHAQLTVAYLGFGKGGVQGQSPWSGGQRGEAPLKLKHFFTCLTWPGYELGEMSLRGRLFERISLFLKCCSHTS